MTSREQSNLTSEQHVCAFVKAHPELRDADGYIRGEVLDALAGLVSETERRVARKAKEAT